MTGQRYALTSALCADVGNLAFDFRQPFPKQTLRLVPLGIGGLVEFDLQAGAIEAAILVPDVIGETFAGPVIASAVLT